MVSGAFLRLIPNWTWGLGRNQRFKLGPCHRRAYMINLLLHLLDLLSIPRQCWVGAALGALAALVAWLVLPRTVDRGEVADLLIVFGFFAGLIYMLAPMRHDDPRA